MRPAPVTATRTPYVADRWLAMIAALVIMTTLAVSAGFRHGYHPIPRQSICVSQLLFHRACPGCGLTRSFVAMGNGDLSAAIDFNPLGPVLFAAVWILLLSRIGRLVTGPNPWWKALDVLLVVTTLGAMVLRSIAFYVR